MYLKSIEVQGFKSFAQRMTFEFHNGITGIVGPNGSGKSNVVDAVRWVFGEQSAKQLRGGNMQDVIFAGTELRKPQSYASVAITLDNSDHSLSIDFEEVKVTRRLYRSGESEYLLNDSPVRLRDINELFYDTGIGKEGYSIISQNQIEKIFSGRSEDRRELFDEAAGIVKFKRRKNASIKKLEEEHQNLLRVNDILAELNAQIGPLEKQSETARIFLGKKEELKRLDINMFLMELDRIAVTRDENREKTENANKEFREASTAFEEAKVEYEKLEKDIEELDRKIAEAHHAGMEALLLKQQHESAIGLIKEQLHTEEVNREHIEGRKNTIREEIEKREQEKEELSKEQLTLSEQIRAYEEERTGEEAVLKELEESIDTHNREMAKVQEELIELLNGRATVKGKGQRYDALLEQIGIRSSEISARMLRLKEEENEVISSIEDHKKQSAEIEETILDYEKQIRDNEEALKACQSVIDEANRAFDVKQPEFHKASSRLDSLKALAERYEGYGNGIRRVMEERTNRPGIKGVVADLLRVDKKYEVAIENALGNKQRNIVTDREETAKEMIALLKREKLGRATFLPMNALKAKEVFDKKEVLSEDGVIDIASKLVRTEEGYEQLADYLLGRILVVSTIDDAIRLSRKYEQSIHMVTLEGELFSPGGAITGGTYKNPGTLLGRRREIEELEGKVASLHTEVEDLQRTLDEKRDARAGMRKKAESLNESVHEERLRLNTVQLELRQEEERLGLSRVESQATQKESAEIAGQIAEVRSSSVEIEEALKNSLEKEEALNEKASGLDQETTALQEKRDEQAMKIEEIRLSAASIVEKNTYLTDNLERLDREIGELKNEDKVLSVQLSTGMEGVDRKFREIDSFGEKIKEAERMAEESAGEEERHSKAKLQLNEDHKSFFEKRDALSEQVALLDKELYRLNAERERLDEQFETQTSYMWEEYEITPSEAQALRAEELSDRKEVRRRIQELKSEIRSLGNVNVNAIEEYKTVKERHTFLSTQQEDLVRSEESLIKIIEELKEGMRRQFREQFAGIRNEFDKVVKEMFGGGTGTLELKDEGDILETDISIIVQPPGKKLQNISLLSGGERTLTAIALLFAIQNLKPSPFALLDEIEAALDEQNIERFAVYLKKLSRNTQFIVITHRRGTMAVSDRLYGITMQEKGISTLVSVSLIEGELDS